jgi:hypothetical protein
MDEPIINETSKTTYNKCGQNNNQIDEPESPNIPFWSDNPNILLDSKYIFEFFPTENMTYEQKLNCISRLIIVLTIIGFGVSGNIRLLIVSVITLGFIFLLYLYQKRESLSKKSKKVSFENFESSSLVENAFASANVPIPTDVFDTPTANNPLSNVLMTDYDYNPHKKPAPPSYNENVSQTLLSNAKELVVNANPDHPDIANKLFKDLGDEFMFEQSLRPFVSNPATTIPNDQQAFAEFCFGSMVSAKEGNMFSLARNLSRYTN